MKETISITLIIAFACGLILSTAGLHSMSVFAQTNTTKQNTTAAASSGTNATKASGASAGNSTAQQQQPSANKSTAATGGKSSTPPATTTTVKGGPKAAGTASQLNQIEGNNTNIISKGANIANKPGIAGLSGESNVTGK
jgi:cytoskeletal protein RodZ